MSENFTDTLLEAADYITPSYIYSEERFAQTRDVLRDNLPAGTGLCFAVKANPFMASTAADYYDRLEVCSPGEYDIIMRAGIDPAKIIFSGVNKTGTDVFKVLDHSKGKGLVTVESPLHYRIIKAVAARLSLRPRLLLRLSSGNQFGMDKECLLAILKEIVKDNTCDVIGIHYYGGTQKSIKKLDKELAALSGLAAEIETETGLTGLELEYGPGLEVNYFIDTKAATDDTTVDENDVLTGEETETVKEFSEHLKTVTGYSHICIELGRFAAAGCGYFISRVMDLKVTEGNAYAIIDGGIHQLNYFGQMLGMKLPHIELISVHEGEDFCLEDADSYNICGSLCTVNDVLVRNAKPGKIYTGDILVFKRCGAYSVTEGSALFLSRELPKVVLLKRDGSIRTLRNIIQTNPINAGE